MTVVFHDKRISVFQSKVTNEFFVWFWLNHLLCIHKDLEHYQAKRLSKKKKKLDVR